MSQKPLMDKADLEDQHNDFDANLTSTGLNNVQCDLLAVDNECCSHIPSVDDALIPFNLWPTQYAREMTF